MDNLNSVDDLLHLSPIKFQEMTMLLYKALGCEAAPKRIAGRPHLYIDIITKDNKKSLAECRIGLQPIDKADVHDFLSLLKKEKAVEGAIISMGEVTPQARREVKKKSVYLYDGNDFLSLWKSLHIADTKPEEARPVPEVVQPVQSPFTPEPPAPFASTVEQSILIPLNPEEQSARLLADEIQASFQAQSAPEPPSGGRLERSPAEIHRLFGRQELPEIPPELVVPPASVAMEGQPVLEETPVAPEPAPDLEELIAAGRSQPVQAEEALPVVTPPADPTQPSIPAAFAISSEPPFHLEPEPEAEKPQSVEDHLNVIHRLFGPTPASPAPAEAEPHQLGDLAILDAISKADEEKAPVFEVPMAAEVVASEAAASNDQPLPNPELSEPAPEPQAATQPEEWIPLEQELPGPEPVVPEPIQPVSQAVPALEPVEPLAGLPVPPEPLQPLSQAAAAPVEVPEAEATSAEDALAAFFAEFQPQVTEEEPYQSTAAFEALPVETQPEILSSQPEAIATPEEILPGSQPEEAPILESSTLEENEPALVEPESLPVMAGTTNAPEIPSLEPQHELAPVPEPAQSLPDQPEAIVSPEEILAESQPEEAPILETSTLEENEPALVEPESLPVMAEATTAPEIPTLMTQPELAPVPEPAQSLPGPLIRVLQPSETLGGLASFAFPDNPALSLAAERIRAGSACVLVNGRPGTGKKALLDQFLKLTSKNVIILSATEADAIALAGETIHSFFHFPAGPLSAETIQAATDPSQLDLYRHVDVIVLQRVSAIPAAWIDAMDAFLRISGRNPASPFGGSQLILLGDLYQASADLLETAPADAAQADYHSPYFYDAHVFQVLPIEMIELQKDLSHREGDLVSLLDSIRVNAFEECTLKTLHEHVRTDFLAGPDEPYVTITTDQETAAKLNREHLRSLPGPECLHMAEVEGEFTTEGYPTQKELLMRRGAQVELLYDDRGHRWVKGTLAKVTALSECMVQLEVISEGSPFVFRLERETWEKFRYCYNPSTSRIEKELVGEFTQYPIRLAWALPLHEIHGDCFDKVVVDLPGEQAYPAQVYAALCHCRTTVGLVLLHEVPPSEGLCPNPRLVEFLR